MYSNQQLLKEEEEEHLQKVLIENRYPIWALNRVKMKIKAPPSQDQNKRDNINANGTSDNTKPYMVLPYVKGLSEGMKNVCSKHGVQVHYKIGNNIKSLLMVPKDKDHITKKSGIIYRFKYNKVECDDEYMGGSSGIFGEWFKEHLKAPSPIYDHYITTSQVIVPPLKISVLWIRTSSELSRKQYT